MKKFIFRLQKVMEIKADIEKQKMGDLAKAETVLALEAEKLALLKQRENNYFNKINLMQKSRQIHPSRIQIFYNYIDKLKMMQMDQLKRIDKAKANVEKRRKILMKATQERKVLEKLKEKQRSEYDAEFALQEQNFFDEIASIKFSRKEND